jgi:hypothetical protein
MVEGSLLSAHESAEIGRRRKFRRRRVRTDRGKKSAGLSRWGPSLPKLSVPLFPAVVTMLRRHRTAQKAERLRMGDQWRDSGLVVHD